MRLSTTDLLVLTSLDDLLLILKTLVTFYEMSYVYEEVNCTEPSPSVRSAAFDPAYIIYFSTQTTFMRR